MTSLDSILEPDIQVTKATGAWAVSGAIESKWTATGAESGPLGHPIGWERPTYDTVGRYQPFERGVVVWHPSLGTFLVGGSSPAVSQHPARTTDTPATERAPQDGAVRYDYRPTDSRPTDSRPARSVHRRDAGRAAARSAGCRLVPHAAVRPRAVIVDQDILGRLA